MTISITRASSTVITDRIVKHQNKADAAESQIAFIEALPYAAEGTVEQVAQQALRESLYAEASYHNAEAARFNAAHDKLVAIAEAA